jgi:hypothetical protein
MTYLLVDGHWLLNVMLPVKPAPGMGDELGSYLFLQQLAKWREKTFANKVAVVFDQGIPPFRLDWLPKYKASRRKQKTEKDMERGNLLHTNVEFLMKVLPKCGMRVWRKKAVEGDDLLFALAQNIQDNVVILTGDMDLTQLVNVTTSVQSFKELISHHSLPSLSFDKKHPAHMRIGRDVVAYKALRGDSSDQISPIIKPKPFKVMWDTMLAEKLDPTPQTFIALSKRLNLPLDVEALKANWYVVDLALSPIAASLCIEASTMVGSTVKLEESAVSSLVSSVGMNPANIFPLFEGFRYLK